MIAFSAWHALKGRVDHPLTYQVPRMVRKLVDEAQDTYALFWNDTHQWKRDRWPPYRDRPEIWDHAGIEDFDAMLQVLTALGAVQFRAPGLEADELLASAAHALEGSEPVLIRSDDKDFMQLLSPSTAMQGRVRGAVRVDDIEGILGVTADFVADFLALTGDKVDGIPRLMTPAPAKRLLSHAGHIRDWIDGELSDTGTAALLDGKRDQLRLNLELVDLSRTAVGALPPPLTGGWGQVDRALAVGERLEITYLTDASLAEEFSPLREWGERSRARFEAC